MIAAYLYPPGVMNAAAVHLFVPEGREKLAGGKALRCHPRYPPTQRLRPGGGVRSVPIGAGAALSCDSRRFSRTLRGAAIFSGIPGVAAQRLTPG